MVLDVEKSIIIDAEYAVGGIPYVVALASREYGIELYTIIEGLQLITQATMSKIHRAPQKCMKLTDFALMIQ
jgi:predicted peroxiredoxin